jgi:hypothetical protein
MGTRRESDGGSDRLDAAERGLEWGAAILKARGSLRSPQQLRRRLGDGPQVSTKLGSREQEDLFEGLRASTHSLASSWDCTVEGGGNKMRVRLAEPASNAISWTCTGSAAQVLAAFAQWLETWSPS